MIFLGHLSGHPLRGAGCIAYAPPRLSIEPLKWWMPSPEQSSLVSRINLYYYANRAKMAMHTHVPTSRWRAEDDDIVEVSASQWPQKKNWKLWFIISFKDEHGNFDDDYYMASQSPPGRRGWHYSRVLYIVLLPIECMCHYNIVLCSSLSKHGTSSNSD